MRKLKLFLVGCLGTGIVLGLLGATMFTALYFDLAALVLPLLGVFLFYGWMLFAFLYYRQARQEEFLHLLETAVETEMPLAQALWAYLQDQPRGVEREAWIVALMLFVFPGYYWIWHKRHRFDAKVARVAQRLNQGATLTRALQAEPGIVSRDALLAVAIGEATGKLALSLRTATRSELGPVWLQAGTRLVYPVLLLVFIFALTSYWMAVIMPRLSTIFVQFDEPLPEITAWFVELWDVFENHIPLVLGIVAILAGLLLVLIFSSVVRWYMPGIGRLYAMQVQSRVLRMLGLMLEAGKPIPEALDLLSRSGCFARLIRWKLRGTRRRVEQGQVLADSLRRWGLLSAAMTPLVRAAERMRNLPWALIELGDSRGQQVQRLVRRLSLMLTPLVVVGLGGLVCFIALSMFIPLLVLITKLGD
jgi:type II secretory pathway component PulF